MTTEDKIDIQELLGYCHGTEPEGDVHVYINNVPIGFPVARLDYDWDGSLKIHVEDETIIIKEE